MQNISLSGDFGFLAFLFFTFGITTTILFLRAAWRAMKAHEKIADNLELFVEKGLVAKEKEKFLS